MFTEGIAKFFGKNLNKAPKATTQTRVGYEPVPNKKDGVNYITPSATDDFLADFDKRNADYELNRREFAASVSVESRGKAEPGWRNQDACVNLHKGRVIGVFDGMGGTGRGDIASDAAKRTFIEQYNTLKNIANDKKSAESTMKDMMLKANSRIKVEQSASPENSTIGTTFVGSEIWLDKETGEPMMTVGNSGDSIAYLFRDGKLNRISTEHSFVSFFNDSFQLGIDDQNDDVLSMTLGEYVKKNNVRESKQLSRVMNMVLRPDDGRVARDMTIGSLRNITFGGFAGQNIDDREMSINTIPLRKGDKILLCTDGLTDSTTDADIEKIICDNESEGADAVRQTLMERGIDAQINTKNKRANKKDDITVSITYFEGFEEPEMEIDEEDIEELPPDNVIPLPSRKDKPSRNIGEKAV